MTLGQRIKSIQPPEMVVTVYDERFLLRGMRRSERSQVYADSQGKDGKTDFAKLEGLVLTKCVLDPESKEQAIEDWTQWGDVPACITGPLIGQLMKLNGFDNDDLGKVKNSETTTS
jgi:hypothetical protein